MVGERKMNYKLPKDYKKPNDFKDELYLIEDNQYNSPIKLIQSDLEAQIENGILKAVQEVGIDVNKQELVKALQYDREQYNKGYENAKRKYDRGHGHYCIENEFIRFYVNDAYNRQFNCIACFILRNIAGFKKVD